MTGKRGPYQSPAETLYTTRTQSDTLLFYQQPIPPIVKFQPANVRSLRSRSTQRVSNLIVRNSINNIFTHCKHITFTSIKYRSTNVYGLRLQIPSRYNSSSS